MSHYCLIVPLQTLIAFSLSILFSVTTFAQPYPFEIEIHTQQSTLCVGQILSPEVTIVEAQCLIGQQPNTLTLVAGGTEFANQQSVSVSAVLTHPLFTPTPLSNNVALILSSSPLTFNAYVQPLPSTDASRFPAFADWTCTEVGICSSNGCAPNQAYVSVFPNGPIYDSSTQDVCVGNLGVYDSANGDFTASNYDPARGAFVLNGKYLATNLISLTPLLDRFQMPINDFRITPAGTNNSNARSSTLWSSEAHIYYYVNRFRTTNLTDTFINALGLNPSVAANLLTRQYRPNLQGVINTRLPWGIAREQLISSSASSNASQNDLLFSVKQRGTVSAELDTVAFDPGYVIGLYSGVLSNWITSGNAQWPSDPTWGTIGNTSWQTDIRPAILEGFKLWNAYRFTGKTEVYRYAMLALRRWAGNSCGTTNSHACDKGWNIDNAMMYLDTANPALNNPSNPSWPATASDDTLLFPYNVRAGVGANHFGPQNGGLGGMFIAAIFYDISKEVGLGDYKADLLFWKTMSLLDPAQAIDMTTFGIRIQQAARALWPSTTPGLSWYEQDLVDVLSSRGIRMNGATNFLNNLPPALGTTANPGPGSLLVASTVGLGSSVPETQHNTTQYNYLAYFRNGFTVTTPGTQYVTYQFYKHSKYGACDRLDLTSGTINTTNSTNPSMNHDGALATDYKGRTLGNMMLLSPGNTLTFLRRRQACVSEREGYYPEDVRAVGFRIVKATPNGFTFGVQQTGSGNGRITYQLTIADPSLTLTGPNTGPATYNWTFTEFNGQTVQVSGQQVTYSALINEPFTISVDRIRGSQTDNVTMRERGNDLDRESGRQFNQNFWDAGYPVGFDTLIDRRLVEGRGAYNSALNPVGGAFGVQAHRWRTPNQLVQPLRLTIVAHGLPSGSNPGPFQFQNAVYYNGCIWGSQANVTNFPGCRTDTQSGDFEVQLSFGQTGIDLAQPYAIVTAGALPAYKWTVEFPSTARLQPNTDYYFGGHISASVVSNGYSYNICSDVQATGTAGQPDDMSDWLAGANWGGGLGAPQPQSMLSYLANYPATALSNCTLTAYKFEGITVTQ